MMHLVLKKKLSKSLLKLWVNIIFVIFVFIKLIVYLLLGKQANWIEFEAKLKKLQSKTIKRIQEVSNNYAIKNIPKTDDSYKYKVIRLNSQRYEVPAVTANLLAIIDMNGNIVTEPDIKVHGILVSLVFDKTCFYCKAGGQQNDIGMIKTTNGKTFDIIDVEKVQENGVVLHFIESNDWPMLLRYNIKVWSGFKLNLKKN